MILTGKEILRQMELDTIAISPFVSAHLGPNSYDVTLNANLLTYDFEQIACLDMRKDNPTRTQAIPPEGLVLQPGCLYLGCTNETATSHRYIPMFEGRSSIGRLGINTHITAGFGDVGWGYILDSDNRLICHNPTWTLEIEVVHPIRVYPNVRIGQVYFMKPEGEITHYRGKYSRQRQPQASQLYQDFSESELA